MDKHEFSGENLQSAPPLTSEQKKLAVDFLRERAAVWLLAEVTQDKEIKKHFEKLKGRLMASLKKEQVPVITIMKQMIDTFCKMVADCQDVDQLWHAFTYLGELQEGNVLIAPDGPVPDGYQTNQVPGRPAGSEKK